VFTARYELNIEIYFRLCFIWISEQTVIISLHNIKMVGFYSYNRNGECLLSGADWIFIIQVMCFVWISQQRAIISPHSIN